MKAIILAAGEGSRLRPLTDTTPKPLIKIAGKSILEYTLESIYEDVEEIIIVTKYLSKKFPEAFGDNYKNTPIKYHVQGDKKGTAGALMGLELDLDTLIINGDSIFDPSDLKSLIDFNGYGVLVQKVEAPEKYGICLVDEDNNIHKIVEKPEENVGDLASLGAYKVNSKFFELNNCVELSPRGEYELTDTLSQFITQFPFKAIEIQNTFLDITYPWNILDAQTHLLSTLTDSQIHGTIQDGVHIHGNIILEEGAVIKSGSYIEGNCYIGKDCIIGPNAYIRRTTCIGANSKIGFSVEVKNSVVGENTHIPHLSYLGDSILGNNINIGGGFKVANLRHNKKNIHVPVKGKLTDTGKQKFGTIIGDNSKTGINTLIYPGRVLESNSYTLPGEIAK